MPKRATTPAGRSRLQLKLQRAALAHTHRRGAAVVEQVDERAYGVLLEGSRKDDLVQHVEQEHSDGGGQGLLQGGRGRCGDRGVLVWRVGMAMAAERVFCRGQEAGSAGTGPPKLAG